MDRNIKSPLSGNVMNSSTDCVVWALKYGKAISLAITRWWKEREREGEGEEERRGIV